MNLRNNQKVEAGWWWNHARWGGTQMESSKNQRGASHLVMIIQENIAYGLNYRIEEDDDRNEVS